MRAFRNVLRGCRKKFSIRRRGKKKEEKKSPRDEMRFAMLIASSGCLISSCSLPRKPLFDSHLQRAADFHMSGSRFPHRSEDEANMDHSLDEGHQRVVLLRFLAELVPHHLGGGNKGERTGACRWLTFFYCSSLSQAVINSTITPNMTFTQTSQKFGQWSDVRANTVYGK